MYCLFTGITNGLSRESGALYVIYLSAVRITFPAYLLQAFASWNSVQRRGNNSIQIEIVAQQIEIPYVLVHELDPWIWSTGINSGGKFPHTFSERLDSLLSEKVRWACQRSS